MRWRYFIHRKMQSKFAITTLLIVILVAVVTISNLYVFATFFANTQLTDLEQKSTWMILKDFFQNLWGRILLLFIVNVIIVIIVAIMYSHQFAGPTYKLDKSLKQIIDGDLTLNIRLRRTDELQEIADGLNMLVEKFRLFIVNLNEKISKIEETLQKYEPESETIKTLVNNIKENINDIKTMISNYKVIKEE